MAETSRKDEEMENGVGIAAAVEGIEDRARDKHHTLGNDPRHRRDLDGMEKRLEGHEHAQSHAYIGERLDIAVGLQLA